MYNQPYAFLGQYLVGNGLITEAELAQAIHLQRENNALVGTIALDRGFLDRTQLNHLVRRQVEVDERIGKLAIEEGFMNEEQLSDVLSTQGENHVFLGESLVRMGTISREILANALNRFETQIVAQEQHVRRQLSHHSAAREILITLDVTLRFFYRLGYAVRIVATDNRLPECIKHFFGCEQIFNRKHTGYMGVGMTGVLVKSIAQDARIRTGAAHPDMHAMENMSELVFNLNSLVCKEMKNRGLNVKHGAAFIGPPPGDCEARAWIEMETVMNPMALTYSH